MSARLPRDAREVFLAASIGGLMLIVIFWLFDVVPTTRALLADRVEAMPVEAPAASCSCATRPAGCWTKSFVIDADRGTTAYCALWNVGESCCVTVRP